MEESTNNDKFWCTTGEHWLSYEQCLARQDRVTLANEETLPTEVGRCLGCIQGKINRNININQQQGDGMGSKKESPAKAAVKAIIDIIDKAYLQDLAASGKWDTMPSSEVGDVAISVPEGKDIAVFSVPTIHESFVLRPDNRVYPTKWVEPVLMKKGGGAKPKAKAGATTKAGVKPKAGPDGTKIETKPKMGVAKPKTVAKPKAEAKPQKPQKPNWVEQEGYDGKKERVDSNVYNVPFQCSCGAMRFIKPSDAFQVKACKPCTRGNQKSSKNGKAKKKAA